MTTQFTSQISTTFTPKFNKPSDKFVTSDQIDQIEKLKISKKIFATDTWNEINSDNTRNQIITIIFANLNRADHLLPSFMESDLYFEIINILNGFEDELPEYTWVKELTSYFENLTERTY